MSNANHQAYFIIKVNSAGFGDILRQWFEIFCVGHRVGLKYIHYTGSLKLAKNHNDNKKNIFKLMPFFLQFQSFKTINSDEYKKININIEPSKPEEGLTLNDVKQIRKKINFKEKNIYIFQFSNIYNTINNIPETQVPFNFLPYLKPENELNIILHIRRGDTSFIPINEEKYLCSSGNIYKTFGQILVNEKTVRERYIPIKFYENILKDVINENEGKKIKIFICSDGYSIFEKHIEILKNHLPTSYKNEEKIIELINQFAKKEIKPLINFIKSKKIEFELFNNEKKTDLNEMIEISKNCNYLIYGKSCFFQNIIKYLYNQKNLPFKKIDPPFYYYMKKGRGNVKEKISYENIFLINLIPISNTNTHRGIVFYRDR